MVPTSAPFGCNAAYEKSGAPAAAAGRMMMMINPITGDSLTPRGTASPSVTGTHLANRVTVATERRRCPSTSDSGNVQGVSSLEAALGVENLANDPRPVVRDEPGDEPGRVVRLSWPPCGEVLKQLRGSVV